MNFIDNFIYIYIYIKGGREKINKEGQSEYAEEEDNITLVNKCLELHY